MHSTTVAVDLAKSVFERAIVDEKGTITERLRLNRARFSAFFVQRPSCRVLMEACGVAALTTGRAALQGTDTRWSCCRHSTCVATSGAARPIGPMPLH